jgi:octaprenyl-diphosphate synthase
MKLTRDISSASDAPNAFNTSENFLEINSPSPASNTLNHSEVSMDMEQIMALVHDDFAQTNQIILDELASKVPLISQIGNYLINNGGKRLRPLLTLLSAKALNYSGKSHVLVAAIIEFIHSATLLHDDVVDESNLRRGQPSANAAFGNSASVLTGDFLYSRAFQMMVRTANMGVLEVMAETTNKISEGEVLQLLNCKNPEVTEEKYLEVIYHKTGKLFEASCELPAVIHQSSDFLKFRETLRNYGRYIGNAFQIIDDVLDYIGDEKTIGKKPGDDLREGNLTLPLIYVMKFGTEDQVLKIREAIQQGSDEYFDFIAEAVKTSGALAYCYQRAREEAEKAKLVLVSLPNSLAKNAMMSLCDVAVNRHH